MSTNSELVNRWFQEVWCEPRNPKAIDELMAEDAQLHGNYSPEPVSRSDFKQVWEQFTSTFPDIRIEVRKIVDSGDFVAFHAHVYGTHQESSKPVNFSGTAIVRFRDGQVVESHETWDFASMLMQSGVVADDIMMRVLSAK
ncbi:ester cyclase [Aliikangiella coralliicola]|uniref:Ester cyclase n=1 Tax=Aliikangiella coralliicola TaxID=2592383 RepID=A0A545UAN8_9GAMM|nr:ester cyclase [Aliikangiella coralliicola]TQV86531.1 ester cyclase [Aliikangiella coralliicola]